MIVKCDSCGEKFEKRIAEIRRTKHNFCNKKCKSYYYSNRNLDNKYVIKANGCWQYIGTCNADGYGIVSFQGKKYLAHRLSYMLYKNKNIDGHEICHTCDNPICINPKHLFKASHKENIIDMWSKKRGRSKLSFIDVRYIRRSIKKNKELAIMFNVSERTIRYAKQNNKWRSMEYEK